MIALQARKGNLRPFWSTTGLAVALLAGIVVSIAVGEEYFSLMTVIQALGGGGDSHTSFVVRELRFPRAAVAVVVGAALGLAGMVLQSMSRNPLASPDVLGIVTGAGTGAVALIVLTGDYGGISGKWAEVGLPVAALAGSLLATILLWILTRNESVIRVLLIGVGMQAMFGALTSWLLLKASIVDAGRAIVWLTGSFNAVTMANVYPSLVALVVSTVAVLATYRSLIALSLGNETAIGLGVSINRTRLILLLVCVILSATATAAVGPIAFVALGAPQLAQRLYRSIIPPLSGSILFGGCLVVWADWIGRALFEQSLPVGVVTAALGAPLLVYLVISSTRTGE